MPLSKPDYDRSPMHTRRVTCEGFRRSDGLWDIEGRVIDTKAYAFDTHERGRVEVGDPLHDMSMRLTIDDEFTILAVEAVTDKSPFRICPGITPNFQRLVGIRIGPGFMRQVRRVVGGIEGCTHLVELLGPMATTALQTARPVLRRERADPGDALGGYEQKPGGKPAFLGTCHAYAPTSDVVARLWPQFAQGPGKQPD